MINKTVGIIGCGVMGATFVRGFIEGKVFLPKDTFLFDLDEQKRESLKQGLSIKTSSDLASSLSSLDIIFVAVKPQGFSPLASQLKGNLKKDVLIVSIMAGVSVASIREALGVQSVVRIMPNTPAQIQEGMAAWFSPQSSDKLKSLVAEMLKPFGKVLQVEEEEILHHITAVSGSGPAYGFYFLEAMQEQAEQFGFSAEEARELALQTLKGALLLA